MRQPSLSLERLPQAGKQRAHNSHFYDCGAQHFPGSWKKCLSRKHNPRMSTVRYEDLTPVHRLCVKPDQSITIYKLRDNETNEEFLEFDEKIAFQTACDECMNIKTCLEAGHELVDWRPPTIAGDQGEGTPLDVDPPTNEETVNNTISNSSTKKKRTKKVNKNHAQAGVGKVSTPISSSPPPSRDVPGSPASGATTTAPSAAVAAPTGNANAASSGGGRSKGKIKAAAGLAAGLQKQAAQKPSNKRKSPSPRGSPPAKNKRISTTRSAGTRQSSAGMRRPKGRRSGRGGVSPPPLEEDRNGDVDGGEGDGDDDNLDRAPKMEIDTSVGTSIGSSDVDAVGHESERHPPKRRTKNRAPAAVTPSPKTDSRESFDTSVAPAAANDGIDGGAAASAVSGVDPSAGMSRPCEDVTPAAAAAASAPPVPPKTVAERLEAVKAEEAELLRQFEQVHKRYAKDEATKRAEMEEFIRAGEEALRIMREAKEEALCRISRAGREKGEERRKLTQLRLKEFEAAEEAARSEARERDAKLEAERERLARSWETNTPPDGVSVSAAAPILAEGDSAAAVADPSASGKEAAVSSSEGKCPSGGEHVDGVAPTSDGSPASAASAAAASLTATEENVCSGTDFREGRVERKTSGDDSNRGGSGSHGGGEEAAETAGLGRSRDDTYTGNGSAAYGGHLASQALATRSCTPRDQNNGDAPQKPNGVTVTRTPTEALIPRLEGGRGGGGTEDTVEQ